MDTTSFVQKSIAMYTQDAVIEDCDRELLASGILDSLGIVTIVGRIEEEYHIEVDADDIIPDNFSSIKAISTMIDRYLGE